MLSDRDETPTKAVQSSTVVATCDLLSLAGAFVSNLSMCVCVSSASISEGQNLCVGTTTHALLQAVSLEQLLHRKGYGGCDGDGHVAPQLLAACWVVLWELSMCTLWHSVWGMEWKAC
jgi:hypothetical protein